MENARQNAREVERFCYRLVGAAETENERWVARSIMRLAVGLRRKLEGLEG